MMRINAKVLGRTHFAVGEPLFPMLVKDDKIYQTPRALETVTNLAFFNIFTTYGVSEKKKFLFWTYQPKIKFRTKDEFIKLLVAYELAKTEEEAAGLIKRILASENNRKGFYYNWTLLSGPEFFHLEEVKTTSGKIGYKMRISLFI